jgi:imidazolonepropionase-like amidohydrolase
LGSPAEPALKAGELADVVAVPGDPLENIGQTEHVIS